MKAGKQIRISAMVALVLLFLSCLHCWAVPQQINYQGRLTDASGVALDGTYDLVFRIYIQPYIQKIALLTILLDF